MIKKKTYQTLFQRAKGSSFVLRCLSCSLLFPLGVALLFLPLRWVALPLCGLAILLIWEWTRLVDAIEGLDRWAVVGIVLVPMGLAFYGAIRGSFAALLLGAVGYYYLCVWKRMRGALKARSKTPLFDQRQGAFWGILSIGLPLLSFIALRHVPKSENYLLWVLSIVWTTDTMAYIMGSWIQGPKLWPRLSPSKTWAGALGGVGWAMVVAWGLGLVLLDHSQWFLIGWGIAFSGLSMMGDLLESALKRFFYKKDSGFLIPGHGGFLDRLDSTLVVMPVAAFLYYWKEGLLLISG